MEDWLFSVLVTSAMMKVKEPQQPAMLTTNIDEGLFYEVGTAQG